jgi:hypothetical protein
MYAWARPDYLLDFLSLDQLILYHRHGWNAKKTDAQVFFGVLGEILSGDEKKNVKTGLDEFKKSHPEGISKDGAWQVSR